MVKSSLQEKYWWSLTLVLVLLSVQASWAFQSPLSFAQRSSSAKPLLLERRDESSFRALSRLFADFRSGDDDDDDDVHVDENKREEDEPLFVSMEINENEKNDGNNGTQQVADYYTIHSGDPRLVFSDEYFERRVRFTDLETVLEATLPFLLPICAYIFYQEGAAVFNSFLANLSTRNWVPADGGTYKAQLITPLMNGIVLPAIALLFATLTSTTIGTLRQRQLDVRQCINDEAGELRALSYIVSTLPSEVSDLQVLCRKFLIRYTSRIISESQPEFVNDLDKNLFSSTTSMTDSELHGVIQLLTTTVAKGDEKVSPLLMDQCFQSVARLRLSRQRRLSALQSSYPPEHYALLGILVLAECTGFLIEADQQVLVFLNAVELKILFSMLTGTFSACFAVFYDLLNPFSGVYKVTAAVDQLYSIRLGFRAEANLSLFDMEKEDNI